MNRIAEELDQKLRELGPERARSLMSLVRKAINQVDREESSTTDGWPDGYFEQTAGALAGEPLDRATQSEPTLRES